LDKNHRTNAIKTDRSSLFQLLGHIPLSQCC